MAHPEGKNQVTAGQKKSSASAKAALKKKRRAAPSSRKPAILKALEVLKIDDYDVVILRGVRVDQATGKRIAIWLGKNRPNSLIFGLPEEVEIEHLNEDAMREKGWMRVPEETRES